MVETKLIGEEEDGGANESSSSGDSSNDYNIVDYGAVGDGETLNTVAIQAAIAAAAAAASSPSCRRRARNKENRTGTASTTAPITGRVIVPAPGVYLTGSLVLQSNIELHIEHGATLLGSTHRADYQRQHRWMALLLADSVTNVTVTGGSGRRRGGGAGHGGGTATIDGQGRQLSLNIEELYREGAIHDPNYNVARRRTSEGERPQILEFVNCSNVRIGDVQICNAAGWVQTYQSCTNVVLHRVRVNSDAYWNNDGIDVVDCKNVHITECDINSADDGICLKSCSPRTRRIETDDADDDGDRGNDDLLGVYNVHIRGCRIRSSASAIKLGTASHVAFQHIHIHNVFVYDTYRSVVALESVDGAIVEDVHISNVVARNVGNAVFVRLGQRSSRADDEEKDEDGGGAGGRLRRIHIRNLVADIALGRPDERYEVRGPAVPFAHNPLPCSILGMPDSGRVQDVVLEDFDLTFPGRANQGIAYRPLSRLADIPECIDQYPEFTMLEELPAWAFYVRHVEHLRMDNIRLRWSAAAEGADFRPALVLDDVKRVGLRQFQLPLAAISDRRRRRCSAGQNQNHQHVPQFAFRNVCDVDLQDIDESLVEWIDS
jgi:polygalacturonase